MKLPVSARELARFTPEGCEALEPPPVYLIATPTGIERARLNAAIRAEGGLYWSQADLRARLKAACDELFPPAEAEEKRALVDAFEAAQEETRQAVKAVAALGAAADDEARAEAVRRVQEAAGEQDRLAALFGDLENLALREIPAYRALAADRQLWTELAPLVAARLFLRGWEHVDLAFRKVGGLVAEDCLEALAALHPGHVEAIGWRAFARARVSEDVAKN